MADDDTERDALDPQFELTQAMLKGAGQAPDRLRLVTIDQVSEPGQNIGRVSDPVLLVGGRRDITRVTLAAMAPTLEQPITLPAGAPMVRSTSIRINAPCAWPAFRYVRRAPWAITRTGLKFNSLKMPASNVACVKAPARDRN